MGGTIQAFRVVDDVVARVETIRAAIEESLDVRPSLLLGDLTAGRARARAIASVANQAAEAERLLAPVVTTEPGLARLLDAIRGVQALGEVRRPPRPAIFHASAALDLELRAASAWKGVHDLDRQTRAEVLEAMRWIGAADMTPRGWQVLAGIIGDDVDRSLTPGLPRTLGTGALDLRALALTQAGLSADQSARTSRLFVGHQYWDAWQVSVLPEDVRRARIDQLLDGVPADRTQHDWRELNALLNATDHGLESHPWFPGLRLEPATRAAYVSGYERARELRIDLDVATPGQLDTARQLLRAPGELDELATAIIQQNRLSDVGITGSEASQVRLRHLEPRDPVAARAWMLDVREALARFPTGGPADQLRTTANRLIDHNLARVDQARSMRREVGYANHPDYADLGRVRSIYQLLEQLDATDANAAGRADASTAAASDALSW